MARKSLLIGNGINLLSGNDSWLEVLKHLSGPSKKDEIDKYSDQKPFTLIFEEVALRSGSLEDESEYDLKVKVVDRLGDIEPNNYHEKIMKCGVENILTTNYDYTIEKSYGRYGRSSVMPESKYSIFRRTVNEKCSVWHIHGELEAPNTIMLGHEHYLGCVQKMRNYLSSGVESELVDGKIKSPVKGDNPEFNFDNKPASRKNIYSWVDIFLRDEIHILGFRIDYTENHLWSLLTQKEKMRRKYPNKIGKAFYHFFEDSDLSKEKEAKASILNSIGVEVEVTRWSNNYHEAYDKFFKQYI